MTSIEKLKTISSLSKHNPYLSNKKNRYIQMMWAKDELNPPHLDSNEPKKSLRQLNILKLRIESSNPRDVHKRKSIDKLSQTVEEERTTLAKYFGPNFR
jgi:hypothetical protein